MKTTSILRICAILLLVAGAGLVYVNVNRFDWSPKPIPLACGGLDQRIEGEIQVTVPTGGCWTGWQVANETRQIHARLLDLPVNAELALDNGTKMGPLQVSMTSANIHPSPGRKIIGVRFANPDPARPATIRLAPW
jgi:hypothetical protein